MSVLIKGMTMPRCCEECLAESVEENYYGDVMSTECPFIYKGYTEEVRKTGRLEECPLIEVPTPHGRLIDADELIERYTPDMNRQIYGGNFIFDIEHAPAIIGAEDRT